MSTVNPPKGKLILAARMGADSRYLASRLQKEGLLQAVLWESGKSAALRKLKRYFRRCAIWAWPLRLLDIIAILLFRKWLDSQIVIPAHPGLDLSSMMVDDVNEPLALQWLNQHQPSGILIYGTSLIHRDSLQQLRMPILNIHSGILPKYRNVHSDFWALMDLDYSKIGISVLHLDAGVDSGDLALTHILPLTSKDTLVSVKQKLIVLAADCAIRAGRLLLDGQLPRTAQESSSAILYQTPGFQDILRFFFLGRFRVKNQN